MQRLAFLRTAADTTRRKTHKAAGTSEWQHVQRNEVCVTLLTPAGHKVGHLNCRLAQACDVVFASVGGLINSFMK